MGQNVSHAVMAQRSEPTDSLDFFPTPPWATRALCEWLKGKSPIQYQSVWEPCCGTGDMVKPLREYFRRVLASDIEDRGCGSIMDFFQAPEETWADWVISNPPFNRAEQFVLKALGHSSIGVAAFTRLSFLETIGRYERLFTENPPTYVLPFVERVPIHKGKLTKNGSTATAYCWLVWLHESRPYTTLEWLAPCRSTLEKDTDYIDDETHSLGSSRHRDAEDIQQTD